MIATALNRISAVPRYRRVTCSHFSTCDFSLVTTLSIPLPQLMVLRPLVSTTRSRPGPRIDCRRGVLNPFEAVRAAATTYRVRAPFTRDLVRAPVSLEPIITCGAVEGIALVAAANRVVPASAVDNVQTPLSEEAVPLLKPDELVAVRAASQKVALRGARNGLVAPMTLQRRTVRVATRRILARRDGGHGGVGGRRRADHHDRHGDDQASRHRLPAGDVLAFGAHARNLLVTTESVPALQMIQLPP